MHLRPAARHALGLALAVLTLVPARLLAVMPDLWTVETFDEFDRGRPQGVALGPDGTLQLAPAMHPVKVPPLEESAEPFLWSQAVDSKGTLYVGGGSGGRIYRIPKGAPGAVYYETGDLAVHALAVDRSDVLYAATGPQGKIYRITGEAKGEAYYQPEDRYLWALAVSPKGEVYAAAGEHGIIYKITAKGKAEVFFRTDEFHVVALAFDASGNLLAGTDGRGLLYRIGPQGKATVLYDSSLREISGIAVDSKGTIYASAIGAEGEPSLPQPVPAPLQPTPGQAVTQPGAPPPPPVPLPGLESGASVTVTVSASAAGAPAAGAPPLKSDIIRVEPDGTATSVWSSPSEIVHSLAIDASGRLLFGSGEPGRVRALLSGVQQATLLARLPESQVTSLLATAGGAVYAATSNVGRVYTLDAGGDTGEYLSAARDARTVARWGRIAWRAALPPGGRVEIATRTGNGAIPDATWSDWSAAYTAADGSAISSPPARFLQWRARLVRGGGAGPILSAVTVTYVQANLPPLVRRITPMPPGVVREKLPYVPETDPADLAFTGVRAGSDATDDAAGKVPAKKVYERGRRAFEWEAEDPNGDVLSFDLSFRGESESAWKPLARGLTERYFDFDSRQIPDGLYRVRLEANDAPSNPGAASRSAALISDPLLVDNTPPAVQVTARKGAKGSSMTIEASAADGVGPIVRAEYSLDAARWAALPPADGVNDSRSETYAATLEGIRPGEHTVIVKVTDLLGNVGAGKATFNTE